MAEPSTCPKSQLYFKRVKGGLKSPPPAPFYCKSKKHVWVEHDWTRTLFGSNPSDSDWVRVFMSFGSNDPYV